MAARRGCAVGGHHQPALVDLDEEAVRLGGPRKGAGAIEVAGWVDPQLAARTGDDVVQPVDSAVLEVVLVTRQDESNIGTVVERDQVPDLLIHAGVVRSGAPGRMVAERNLPGGPGIRERRLEPALVVIVAEPVLALLAPPGGVDAHEFEERAHLDSVEEPGPEGCTAHLLAAAEPLEEEEVVLR